VILLCALFIVTKLVLASRKT